MLESVDAGVGMTSYRLRIEEYEALEFCKKFAKERKWCHENGLDYRVLEEEKQFQNYVKKFRFKSKRERHIKKVELYKEVQNLVQNEMIKAKKDKVDEKIKQLMIETPQIEFIKTAEDKR